MTAVFVVDVEDVEPIAEDDYCLECGADRLYRLCARGGVMAMFRLHVSTDNAAFEGDPGLELARILRNVAMRLELGQESGGCLDVNGNTVGSFAIEEDGNDG